MPSRSTARNICQESSKSVSQFRHGMTSIFIRTISDFISHAENGRVNGYTVVAGGGFGMSHGKTDTFPALAKPLFYVAREHVVEAAVAVVTAQRDFGNRADRKRARLKYLIDERGIDWFRTEVIKRLGVPFEPARAVRWNTVSDVLGWHEQGDGKLFCGIWIEEGRIKDTEERRWRTAFRTMAEQFGFPIRLTTNCNIIFHDIDPAAKEEVVGYSFEARYPAAGGPDGDKKTGAGLCCASYLWAGPG